MQTCNNYSEASNIIKHSNHDHITNVHAFTQNCQNTQRSSTVLNVRCHSATSSAVTARAASTRSGPTSASARCTRARPGCLRRPLKHSTRGAVRAQQLVAIFFLFELILLSDQRRIAAAAHKTLCMEFVLGVRRFVRNHTPSGDGLLTSRAFCGKLVQVMCFAKEHAVPTNTNRNTNKPTTNTA